MNTGSALAKLGVKTSLVGAVGNDGFGAYLRGELAARGLDLRGLKTLKAASSASIVAVNRAGERSFTHHVGANAHLTASAVDWDFLGRHKLLHVGGSFLMPRLDGKPLAGLLKRARRLGLKTSLDTVYNPKLDWGRILKPCLPHLDYFLPSYEEARQISGKRDPAGMAAAFQRHGAGVVVVKMGEKGSYVHDGKSGARVPALKIKALDTTGAGDAFCAGFLAGRLAGLGLVPSARLGNVLGAACCTRVGAYAGLPGRAQAFTMMKRSFAS